MHITMCVGERERKRERERTCVQEKSVCLCERLRDKDRVGGWLCVCERERCTLAQTQNCFQG